MSCSTERQTRVRIQSRHMLASLITHRTRLLIPAACFRLRHRVVLLLSAFLSLPFSHLWAYWAIESVDSLGSQDSGCISMKFRSDDSIHISYHYRPTQDLKYARWNGVSWSKETVDSAGSVGASCAMALDSSGYPHISYWDYTNHGPKYAKWTGASWSIQSLDAPPLDQGIGCQYPESQGERPGASAQRSSEEQVLK